MARWQNWQVEGRFRATATRPQEQAMSRERERGYEQRTERMLKTLSERMPLVADMLGRSTNTLRWTRYRQDTGQLHVLVTDDSGVCAMGARPTSGWFRRG